jgi:hypothetical protein
MKNPKDKIVVCFSATNVDLWPFFLANDYLLYVDFTKQLLNCYGYFSGSQYNGLSLAFLMLQHF